MRRVKKRNVRSNRRLKYCPINNKIHAAIFTSKSEAKAVEQKNIMERKRLLRTNKVETEDFEIEAKKTKSKIKKEAWKRVSKKLIVEALGKYKTRLAGNPCHGCFIVTEKKGHSGKDTYGIKGKHKFPDFYYGKYINCNAEEAIGIFNNFIDDK
eukprot:TRINITY_DN1025_c0_g1_i23.p1 TRINITY_DN1025_c0_g1~~TRINITY_DN1025_c0_g1_i23.p1  ORF type:complete len:154 (+),score=29.99 TRINITY_DN1025_c0_g1_i23:134-595(+)